MIRARTRATGTAAVALLAGALGLACAAPTFPSQPLTGETFPDGYLDSPYVLPDGSAVYFLHSPSPVKGFGFPWSSPACAPLAGHHATDQALYWFNSDLYVSRRNRDGSFGRPQNLGDAINTKHLECCPWVSDDETVLIFTRESLDNSDKSVTGNFISRRPNRNAPWGAPQRLPGPVGRYLEGGGGLHDLHLAADGDIYAWSEKPRPGRIFRLRRTGPWAWAAPEPVELGAPKGVSQSQPWIDRSGTLMAFNRWTDMDRELWFARRSGRRAKWGQATRVPLRGFEDPNGHLVWGEPSFLRDGTLFFTRFNTARPGWAAELMEAPRNPDGSYGPPRKVRFRF